MRKPLLLILPLFCLLFSCKREPKDILATRWVAVRIDNPELEQMMKDQEMFIDTFGKTNDPLTNEKMYGVKNIDSMRKSLRAQLDTTRMLQEKMMQRTTFDFRNNNLALLNFGQGIDSAVWTLQEHALILDEKALRGKGGMVRMDILELSDTLLVLKYTDKGIATTARFHPENK